jgi:hypothetical protein
VKQRRGIRRPRKVVIRAGIFLLLGAIVNIAVAWGCAWRGQNNANSIFQTWGPSPSGGWMLLRVQSFGLLQIRCGWFRHSFSNEWVSSDGLATPAHLALPLWSHLDAPSDHFMNGHGEEEWAREDGAGWPQLAMRCWYQVDSDSDQRGIESVSGGVDVHCITANDRSQSKPDIWNAQALPATPMWPGFAINTLFYAAILWLLFAAPFALRRMRRIKRGLCPACAYPVGASDLCTECGKPLPA